MQRFYGVMVSTQDSESCDPSSSLGRTSLFRENRTSHMREPHSPKIEVLPRLELGSQDSES